MVFIILRSYQFLIAFILSCCLTACVSEEEYLQGVTVEEFSAFVKATGYTTDAERFGWSFIQETVLDYEVANGVDWKVPKGQLAAEAHMPVTQVSYNDALAYCSWAGVRLPSYDEYWKLAEEDERPVIADTNRILPVAATNIIGNTWDITSTGNELGEIRLAGGSYLCNEHTCNGTNKDRQLYVSVDTGNSHISFSVIKSR